MEGEEDRIAVSGTVVYLAANKVDVAIATTDDDLVFLAIKDMSHGIVGTAADGTMRLELKIGIDEVGDSVRR